MRIYFYSGEIIYDVCKIVFGSNDVLIIEFDELEKEDREITSKEVKEIKS